MLTCSCVLTHEFPQGDVITIFVRKSRIVSSCREPLETVKITGVIEWSHVVEQNSTKVAAQLCLVDPQRGGRQSRNMPANIIVQVDFCHLRRLVPINNGADIADQSNGVWWVNRSTWVTGNMSAVTQEATGRSWMQKISPTVSPVRQYHRVRLWEVDTTVELLIPACIAAYRVGHVDDGDVHEGVVPGVTISAISASHATSGPVEPVAAFHGTPSTTFSRLRKAVPVSKIQVTLSQKPVGREVVWIDVELQPGDVVDVGLQPEVNRQQGTNSSRRASSSTVAQRGRSSHGTVEKSGAPAVPGPRQSARVETRRADLSGDAGPAPRHATTERVPSGLDILAAVTLGDVQQGVLQVPPSAPEAQPFVPAAPAAKKPRLEGCRGPPVNKLPRLSAGTGFGELPALVFPDELGVDPLRVLAGGGHRVGKRDQNWSMDVQGMHQPGVGLSGPPRQRAHRGRAHGCVRRVHGGSCCVLQPDWQPSEPAANLHDTGKEIASPDPILDRRWPGQSSEGNARPGDLRGAQNIRDNTSGERW